MQVAQFHFVEDYEKHVGNLIRAFPLDEAMSLAVGGDYERVGKMARDIVLYAGAKDGMSVLDFGCGSGRVAHFLSQSIMPSRYLGTDVVQSLLDYAVTKTPDHFEFVKHHALDIPTEDEAFDIAYAFSVFTHLLQTEIFLYAKDIARTLKPGGRFVFSFLEMRDNWQIFEDSAMHQRSGTLAHLNMFLERAQISLMAKHIGFDIVELIDAYDARWNGQHLGQSLAILSKKA